MATYSITAVRTGYATGATHDHITRMKLLGATTDYSREQIIAAIRGGDVFYTYANPPAFVHIVRCPTCTFGDYLTTNPDGTKRNNLLDLPHY